MSGLNRGGDPQVDVQWRLLLKLSGWAALTVGTKLSDQNEVVGTHVGLNSLHYLFRGFCCGE